MAGGPPRAQSVRLAIAGPLDRAALPALVQRTCTLLAGGADELVCELAGVDADAVAVDALCRLALVARRRGVAVRMRGVSRELRQLIALIGLDEVLAVEPGG